MEKLASSISMRELARQLRKAKIPLRQWPEGSLECLHRDIQSDVVEVITYPYKDGPWAIEKHVSSVVVDVYRIPSGIRILREAERFTGTKPELLRTAYSVSVKIPHGVNRDERQEVVQNCLKEKLGFKGPFVFIDVRKDQAVLEARYKHLEINFGHRRSFILMERDMYEKNEEYSEKTPGLPILRQLFPFVCVVPNRFSSRKILRTHGEKSLTYEWKLKNE